MSFATAYSNNNSNSQNDVSIAIGKVFERKVGISVKAV